MTNLQKQIAEARRRGEHLPDRPPPPRPAGEGWTLENWFDVDTAEHSWHWVCTPSPEDIEKAIGQADGEGETGRNRGSAPRQSARSDYLTTMDAVAYCNVSRSQFFEWVKRGYVKRTKIGRYVRYSIKALEEMLKRFEQQDFRAARHKRRIRRNPFPAQS